MKTNKIYIVVSVHTVKQEHPSDSRFDSEWTYTKNITCSADQGLAKALLETFKNNDTTTKYDIQEITEMSKG